MVYNKNMWKSRYGDWAVTIQPLADKLVTPPASAAKKQYTLTCKGETSPRIIEAAIDGNDIYLKGISKSKKLADIWVKLTKDGNKAVEGIFSGSKAGAITGSYVDGDANIMGVYGAIYQP